MLTLSFSNTYLENYTFFDLFTRMFMFILYLLYFLIISKFNKHKYVFVANLLFYQIFLNVCDIDRFLIFLINEKTRLIILRYIHFVFKQNIFNRFVDLNSKMTSRFEFKMYFFHFSINKINSLVDFQFCKRLEELFIRQNDIHDLNEIMYLQNLPNLKNLWLGENPCAKLDGYRLAVIKALPQLQKLDNVQITQDELKEAQRRGKNLCHPDDAQDESEEEYNNTQYNRYQEPETEYTSVQRSPPRQDVS